MFLVVLGMNPVKYLRDLKVSSTAHPHSDEQFLSIREIPNISFC